MGLYINKLKDGTPLPHLKKANFLIHKANAIYPDKIEYQPNLVCVVENGIFDAAAYCFDEKEFEVFKHPDGRPKTWLIVPNAEKLAK